MSFKSVREQWGSQLTSTARINCKDNYIQFHNKKWGSLDLSLRYGHLKLQLGEFLTGYTLAMVTLNVQTIIITCSSVIAHLFDTIIVASTEN